MVLQSTRPKYASAGDGDIGCGSGAGMTHEEENTQEGSEEVGASGASGANSGAGWKRSRSRVGSDDWIGGGAGEADQEVLPRKRSKT